MVEKLTGKTSLGKGYEKLKEVTEEELSLNADMLRREIEEARLWVAVRLTKYRKLKELDPLLHFENKKRWDKETVRILDRIEYLNRIAVALFKETF